ncbi:hypothetical protein DWB97_08605 [Staphylococcus chromogenes]|uniref:hypothetical protein n=1 Tax=Staphylococcus chromogenes TaxID=46126 RepID=UPI001189744B|nr:hypothetical protein [Staphylococcus chromogenes]QDW90465.1 hypothetical protein DWB97_00050 [Staphylococcus chromogenes]QDW92032.1 hypothetical protein DWB97_08605 [Staphylococcus chromogenes]
MRTVLALRRSGDRPTQSSGDKFQNSKMEQAYRNYKAEREVKPWLTTVPQSKPLSKYGKYLSDNIKIGAYKVDCYGRQQLI